MSACREHRGGYLLVYRVVFGEQNVEPSTSLFDGVTGDEVPVGRSSRRPGKHGRCRFQEFCVGDGLGEICGNADVPGARAVSSMARRGQHHQSRLREFGVALDEGGHLKPVAYRHVPVDDCHVVGRTVGDRLPHRGQGRVHAVAVVHLGTSRRQHAENDAAGRRVVVNDENPLVLYAAIPIAGSRIGFHLDPESDSKTELAAASDFAGHPQLSAHEPDQPSGNRQPQAGSAVSARDGGVCLSEFLEDGLQAICGNPNAGIANGEHQGGFVVSLLLEGHRYRYLSALRESDGVAHEIGQDLP